jgi:hypothetical protein
MTPRETGRRTMSTGASSGRSAMLGAMVVALTAAVLTLAGTTPRGIGTPVQTFERVELEQRTFVCGGGIPDAVAGHGDVEGGLGAPTPIGDSPQVFEDDKSVAPGAFAGQESRAKDWLAWLPCPEPRARWWFVGAGAATVSHDTVLTITNPRAGQAVLDVDVYGADGPVASPGLHGITIPAGGTRVIDLAKSAPTVGEVAVNLVAKRGLVSVSAADRFAPGFVGKPAQEWLPTQSLPGTSVTMTGLPAKPDRATLVVANPRRLAAVVSVEVIGATGTFAPTENATLTVPPHSVASQSIESAFNGDPLAIRVVSEQPVTASVRTVTDGDVAFGTGVRPVRGSTAFALPSGTGQLVLSSLGPESAVALTAFGQAGKQLVDSTVTVPKASSVASELPAGTRYVRLVARSGDAVAGFSVTDPAGIATGGVVPSIRSLLLPVVRPGW